MTLLTRIANRLPLNRGDDLLGLYGHGEHRLALEMIIENLYEFEVPVTRSELEFLVELASQHLVEERLVDLLRSLPGA